MSRRGRRHRLRRGPEPLAAPPPRPEDLRPYADPLTNALFGPPPFTLNEKAK